jgi:hypothetical protein
VCLVLKTNTLTASKETKEPTANPGEVDLTVLMKVDEHTYAKKPYELVKAEQLPANSRTRWIITHWNLFEMGVPVGKTKPSSMFM